MSKKVLLVDDYADIRKMTRFMIEIFGYDVIEAVDGYDALQQAEEHCPDIVLMDIAMPLVDGITSAKLIHALDSCRNIPIVAITAYGHEYMDRSNDFGFDAVVQKPIEMDHLKNLLRDFIGGPEKSAVCV